MKIKKTILAYLRRYYKKKPRMVFQMLLGTKLYVYEGTIGKTDKDDAWFYALSRNCETIFDIGSNIGHTAILASIIQPAKRILLVEANPTALSYAAENLIRNHLSASKLFISCFVGDKVGEQVKFYTVGAGAAGSMYAGHAETASATNSFTYVPTTTIDKLVADTGWVPDIAKIDIEGAESMALAGATGLAAKQRTMFFVEMHAPPEMPMLKNAQLVLDWCNANHYAAHYMTEHVPLLNAKQLAARGRCHLLLLPANTPYPEYLRGIKEYDIPK